MALLAILALGWVLFAGCLGVRPATHARIRRIQLILNASNVFILDLIACEATIHSWAFDVDILRVGIGVGSLCDDAKKLGQPRNGSLAKSTQREAESAVSHKRNTGEIPLTGLEAEASTEVSTVASVAIIRRRRAARTWVWRLVSSHRSRPWSRQIGGFAHESAGRWARAAKTQDKYLPSNEAVGDGSRCQEGDDDGEYVARLPSRLG